MAQGDPGQQRWNYYVTLKPDVVSYLTNPNGPGVGSGLRGQFGVVLPKSCLRLRAIRSNRPPVRRFKLRIRLGMPRRNLERPHKVLIHK
jgi:hypothetical protein